MLVLLLECHCEAAAPPRNLVGLTGRSAESLANQRSAVCNSGTQRSCERALPPHPGPLPSGEGVHHRLPSFQAGPLNIRKHLQAVPSPRGEGQGEGNRGARISQPPTNHLKPGRARLSERAAGRTLVPRKTPALAALSTPRRTARSDGPYLRRSAEHHSGLPIRIAPLAGQCPALRRFAHSAPQRRFWTAAGSEAPRRFPSAAKAVSPLRFATAVHTIPGRGSRRRESRWTRCSTQLELHETWQSAWCLIAVY